MRVKFFVVGPKQRERDVADAAAEGIRKLGDECIVATTEEYVEPEVDVDVACVFALKGQAKTILDAYHVMGARTLLFDKGLIRASTGLGAPTGYYRVSIDEFMPIGRIERMMREGVSANRWVATGLRPRDRVKLTETGPVIYAGSSQKYCDFHGLGDEHEYAEDLCRRIRKQTPKKRDIIYRPKPSFNVAKPVEGTRFSRPPEMLGPLLSTPAYALVTHGSHAAIDAILAGVPAVVLGPAAAQPVSATDLSALNEYPPFPEKTARFKWLSAIAHWQYTVPEMVDGTMWRFLRDEMEKPAA